MASTDIEIQVDVWLRGENVATTRPVPGVTRPPAEWVDEDVRTVLLGMLRVMHTLKHPEESDRPVTLRGLSWIVNPYEEGGVVIAIEITLGAAIAGPFAIEKSVLEAMITRVLRTPAPVATSDRVH
jgi:hypothetical protein